MRILMAALGLLALTGCISVTGGDQIAATADTPNNREALAIIQERNTLYEDLIAAQDIDGLIALHTDDALILRPGMRNVAGQADHRSYWEDAFRVLNRLEVTEQDVFFAGPDTIISRDTYKTFYDDTPGNAGQSVIIWKRVSGEWLVHWEMFN